MITRKEAWSHLVELARTTNKFMTARQDELCLKRSRRRKKNRMGTKPFRKISYKYHSSNKKDGTHVYSEIEAGTGVMGRVVLGRLPDFKIGILRSYVIFPAPKPEPVIKVTKVRRKRKPRRIKTRKSGSGFRWTGTTR